MAQAQETRNTLVNWRRGAIVAEEMVGGLLLLDKFTDVEPINQQGGADGRRDIRCKLRGVRHVCACYFPPTALQITFAEVKVKFLDDLTGVKKDRARAFVFATNVTISEQRRVELRKLANAKGCGSVRFYTVDELCLILNDRRGLALREQHLGISTSPSEAVAIFVEMQRTLMETVLRQAMPPRSPKRPTPLKKDRRGTRP